MRIEHYLIAAAIFGLFITIGYNFLLDQVVNYDLTSDPGSVFDEELRGISGEVYDTSRGLEGDTNTDIVGAEDTEAALYKKGYPGVLNIWDSNKIAGKAIDKAGQDTGLVPSYVKDWVQYVFYILAGAFTLYMIWRFKPQND